MTSDYELIMAGDYSELRARYRGYIYRLACAFANDRPAMAHELTERTFVLLASEPFQGDCAFLDGQPTVKRFIVQKLNEQWSEMVKRERALNAEPGMRTTDRLESSSFDIDTDTSRC